MYDVIGGVFNAVRGAQWREWLGVSPSKYKWVSSDALNAIAFGIVVLIYTKNPVIASCSVATMWLGASSGWGDYIGALGGWRTHDLKENKVIDPLIKSLINKPKWWGFAGLTVRGLVWGVLLSAPFFYYGNTNVAAELIIRASSMAVVYWFAIEWMRYRVGQPQHGWGLGEVLFGMVLWGSLN